MDATPLQRRHSRRVRGLPPEPLRTQVPKRKRRVAVPPPINDPGLQPGEPEVADDAVSMVSNASAQSVRSTTSSTRLRLLEAERETMREVRRIEVQMLLNEKEALLKDLELAREIAAAEEEADLANELPESPTAAAFRPIPAAPASNKNCEAMVHEWLNNEPLERAQNPYAANKLEQMNGHLEKLLARQTVPRDLPSFSGEPGEWFGFINQFNETTNICGLSKQENMVRLNKCLNGKARDAVAPILGLPDNVPLVINTLEMLFGRPSQIVKSLVEKTRCLPQVNESNPESIITLASAINNLVATMKNYDLPGHLNNPALMDELVSKLPPGLQLQWCMAERLEQDGSLGEFANWMMQLARAASFMPTTSSKCLMPNDPGATRKQAFTATKTRDSGCPKCQSADHGLTNCSKFRQDSVEGRWDFVANKKLCFSCLKSGHRTSQCTQKRECGVQGCKQPHNSLLHRPSFP